MHFIRNKILRSYVDIIILRACVIFIFLLFGTYKWFDFEVVALKPIISNSWLDVLYTLLGFHGASYFLGVVESVTFVALFIGYFKPVIGVIGSFLVILTGLVTLSLLPQLGYVDSFIVKDVLLIGSGIVLIKFDLLRIYSDNSC
jgi:uncharacterized membrane protein YkgB